MERHKTGLSKNKRRTNNPADTHREADGLESYVEDEGQDALTIKRYINYTRRLGMSNLFLRET